MVAMTSDRTPEACRKISQGYAFFAYPRLIP